MAGTGITIFTGSLLLTGNSLSFTVFLTFVLISLRIYAPVAGSIALTAELFYFANSTKRMRMLTDEPIMTGDMTELHDFGIEFDHVTFAYNDESVIKDVSCRIEPGSVTAIVGPSGSGKSTMARLIARFFDIQKGKISIGGVDISALDPEYLMRYMSFVFQDVVLFNDTVYNNIKIGNPEASREEILKAAGEAMCDEFANKLPDAYDSVIGENGCTLSGGERQRISIARALLKNAPIILLDEATAALDPENEVSIQDAVTKLIADKTVVVIAHRLRTVSNADKILVLDNGKLTEEGTHSRLMEKGGLYAKMVEIQASSAGFSIAESDCEK
jgi:ATP-binding cassette subfamily B protein